MRSLSPSCEINDEEKNADQISLGILIKSGTYSELWTGKFYHENFLVTVKRYKRSNAKRKLNEITNGINRSEQASIKRFMNELDILSSIDHTNIIRMWTKCTQALYLVMEHMKYGSLVHFLTHEYHEYNDYNQPYRRGRRLTLEHILVICFDLASALKYLESARIIHGDVAARNVMVGDYDKYAEKYVVKLADFEFAYRMTDHQDFVEVSFKERKI